MDPCSFGGRPGLGAHHALAPLTEVITGWKVSWVLEAELENIFAGLDRRCDGAWFTRVPLRHARLRRRASARSSRRSKGRRYATTGLTWLLGEQDTGSRR